MLQSHDSASPFSREVQAKLPIGVEWTHLEYVAPLFPWGYTAGTADLVMTFRNQAGRRVIVVVECKRDTAHDEAVLQVILYAERVLQVAFASIPPDRVLAAGEPVDIITFIVAKGIKKIRADDARLAVPQLYSIERSYLGGPLVRALVHAPQFLCYDANGACERDCGSDAVLADRLTFTHAPSTSILEVDWSPQVGSVGTTVELNQILNGSWADARAAAAV